MKRDSQASSFVIDRSKIYAGSLHVSEIQWRCYESVFLKYCKGKMLDCGCGNVPYFEMLKQQVTTHYCIDWSEQPHIIELLDEKIDLNKSFVLLEKEFDCALVSDVLAHVKNPSSLIADISMHLKVNGHLILTTPFVYWMSEFPHEYFHPTEFALRELCRNAGLEVIQLESYGGYPDVVLDTLNKGMTSRFSNRIFRMLASVVKKTSWYDKSNEKTKYSYPIGYTMVARKL